MKPQPPESRAMCFTYRISHRLKLNRAIADCAIVDAIYQHKRIDLLPSANALAEDSSCVDPLCNGGRPMPGHEKLLAAAICQWFGVTSILLK